MLAETFPRVPNVSFPQNVAAPRKLPKSNWILTIFSFHLLKVNFTWNSSEYLPRKKCDSADERLLVKRRAGGRQLTIVPDITFFTRHHCTDIAPTNTQWEQSKPMFFCQHLPWFCNHPPALFVTRKRASFYDFPKTLLLLWQVYSQKLKCKALASNIINGQL